jgi:serine/threonine protein kinase
MSDLVGQQWGNYRLLRRIGQGGFAEVYLGEHVRLRMLAALKILHSHLPEEGSEAFQHEAQVIAELSHPHIVRMHDFDLKEGRPFLVMDYAPNGSLHRLYPRGMSVSLSQVVVYVKQVASALQYAHDRKLIHRDVKPENMLLGQHNELLLSDFGIVAIAHATSSMSAQSSAGTIPYMAPEQIQSHPRPASDQYALAIVVYQWLCGELPFQGSFPEIVAKQLSVAPPSLREKNPHLPAEIEQVVLMALKKEPKERFSNVQAFATALEQASVSQERSATQFSFASSSTLSTAFPLSGQSRVAGELSVANASTFTPQPTLPTPTSSGTPAREMPPTPMTPDGLAAPPATAPARKVAFKQGLIFGSILPVVDHLSSWLLGWVFISFFSATLLSANGPATYELSSWGVSLLVSSIIFFFAAMRTAFLTGKVRMAFVTCLWMVFLRLLVDPILYWAEVLLNKPALSLSLQMSLFLPYFVLMFVSSLILGAGLGALGGLAGRRRRKKAQRMQHP